MHGAAGRAHATRWVSSLAPFPAHCRRWSRGPACALRRGDAAHAGADAAALLLADARRRRCAGRATLHCTAMTRTSAIVAKQRRCGQRLARMMLVSSLMRAGSEHCIASEAASLRESGAQRRAAVTWEANALVAFCHAARQDADVRKALRLLEVRAQRTRASAAVARLTRAGRRTRVRWTRTSCCYACGFLLANDSS